MKAKNTPFSKILRKDQTPWESKLWYYLRGHRFKNFKFKRQVPIENFIVDFCCQKPRLIIELDGGCHNQDEKQKNDEVRDEKLSNKGYTILRFWNNEIDNNIEGVLEVIEKNIKRPLPKAWAGVPLIF